MPQTISPHTSAQAPESRSTPRAMLTSREVRQSAGFPVTPDSYQPFNRGANDAFISKLVECRTSSAVSVLNNGDTPLSGAEVVLNDGGSLTSVLTESDGSYQFSRLREGGNYTVSASKPHFTMTPASQTFNNLNSDQVLDFTALHE